MIDSGDGGILFSASDLTGFLACEHLTLQKLLANRGERGKLPKIDDPHGELVKERGFKHEDEQLRLLIEAAGGDHVDIEEAWDDPDPESDWEPEKYLADLEEKSALTESEMRAGRALISQATLFVSPWQGRADVLRRIERPSSLGDFSYEVLDMKLARRVKPSYVHQLALYSTVLEQIQGVFPEFSWLILGDGSEHRVDLAKYMAVHRRAKSRLEAFMEAGGHETYPEPVAFCSICDLATECYKKRVEDDHLSLVAFAARGQRTRLQEAGVETLEGLATASDDLRPKQMPEERFGALRGQAGIQLKSRESGQPEHQNLEPEPGRGYALLPEPDPADLFFDLEGDPYVGDDGGIEYLWGWSDSSGDYECEWAHDRTQEKLAFERFIDLVHARWQENPRMHVFHYAPHEISKITSLSVQYGTCEREVDDLLRAGVFIDLYLVVRQAMQVGEESYSLKKLERHHGFERKEKEVREGGGSIIAYENWLETRDDEILETIRKYNLEDCESTRSLRDWLVDTTRQEAVEQFGLDAIVELDLGDESTEPEWVAEVQEEIDRLKSGLGDDPANDSAGDAERRLLGDLILYHRRENKPDWWRFFELHELSPLDLMDERDAVYGLERDDSTPPVPEKQSLLYRFTFPEQEFKLRSGMAVDPFSGASYNVFDVGDNWLLLKQGKKKPAPHPRALIGGKPPDPKAMRTALLSIAADLLDGDGSRFGAARSILRSEPPKTSAELGESEDELIEAALGLSGSHLAVQGPPGTGKTYMGSRMIVAALKAGKRVAVSAPSHAAIQNLLEEVEKCAKEKNVSFAGVYRGDGYESPEGLITEVDDNKDVEKGDYQLVAGTSWLPSRSEWTGKFDLLFIDEAGQYSLASAAAVATSADSVVLLGDPQQLPQVNKTTHPGDAGTSVLEHQLQGAATIAADRGVLLTESWRMHPEVCDFVSSLSYDGRLHSRDACAQREVRSEGSLAGAGLRFIPVVHEGRSQHSEEEAEAIARACCELLDGSVVVIDDEGSEKTLQPEDILVVAPYNMAVQAIRRTVPEGVRVGTVDKFQGQEAPVVFFAMTSSSGEDVPRGLDFVFNRNRFNVAVSRAQCLAVLVACPRLLDANCPTVGAMELVDGACRFVEKAGTLEPA